MIRRNNSKIFLKTHCCRNGPCCSLLRLPRMGRHSLWHVDVVSMAVVRVHPVRVWGRTLMCSPAKRNQTHVSYTKFYFCFFKRQDADAHVGCCIILRLWTSILCNISCWWSRCTEGPRGGRWCGRGWWSVERCWASGALELERWWEDRGGGGAGVTAWPGGWDDSCVWKAWGMRKSPCGGGWAESWGFPWEWGQAEEGWWCSARVREPSGNKMKEKIKRVLFDSDKKLAKFYIFVFVKKKTLKN